MNFENLKTVFTEAAAKASPQARAAYLDEACAGDPSLRAQIESLLAAQDQLGDFIEPAFLQKSAEESDATGTRIGPYTLLEKIGEGGFGVVYMAEQEQPVRRKVALKVIKAGMDTKQVIARFEVERQALALMDHPNIARVLDAGETQDGRPYFVMELVRGLPITEFCEQREIPIRERLRLFIQATPAIQHAHQKGIIHRDLKPSNVMITMIDGAPVPKVIDFGVAKAIAQRLTEKTLFTRYDQLIGTPAYMSPEQAELSGQDVDTRSDIYALGCLLYELLTGTAPIEKETLRKAGFDEIRRLIRETDPPTPSTRARQLARATSDGNATVAPRPTPPSTDLDWIVMKCLEKDRARRYATASDLAADLERHLRHEPVTARPPSQIYRLGKFTRRHRLQVGFGVCLGIAIIGGLIFSWAGFAQARRERDRALGAEQQATTQERLAQTEAIRSAQVAQFLQQILTSVNPARAKGRDTTLLREILDDTVVRLPADLAGQPEVEADLRRTLGGVYFALGDTTNAAAMHLEAVRLLKEHFGEDHLEVARALYWFADMRQQERKYLEAESLFRESLTIRRRLLGDYDDDVARSLIRLAAVLKKQGGTKVVEAREKLAEAERLARDQLAKSRASPDTSTDELIKILGRLSHTLGYEKKYSEAEPILREIVTLQRGLPGDNRQGLGSALYRLAQSLRVQGKLLEAEAASGEALALWQSVLPRDSASLHSLLRTRAVILDDLSRHAEAEALLRESLGIQEKKRPESWDTVVTRGLLGGSLLRQRRHAEAEPLLLAAYEGFARQDDDDVESENWWQLRTAVKNLAQLYEETARPAQAAEWKRKLAELDRSGQ